MLLRVINSSSPPETIDITDKTFSVSWHPQDDSSKDTGCTISYVRIFAASTHESKKELYYPECKHIFVMENGKTVERIVPQKKD